MYKIEKNHIASGGRVVKGMWGAILGVVELGYSM